MAIIRTPIQDDDGSGYTGTILNNVWKQELYDQIDAYAIHGADPGVITIVNGGGNLFDVVLPTQRPFYYVRVYPVGGIDITIRSITAGRPGDLVLLENIGSANTWLPHWNGSVGFLNRVTSGPTPIAPLGSALYVFDAGGQWSLAQHDQGKAIRVPFNAGNYLASSGSWTVAAGNVSSHDYLLRGNVADLELTIANSVYSGGGTNLYVYGLPFTAHAQSASSLPGICSVSAPTEGWGLVMVSPASTGVSFNRTDFGPFGASNSHYLTAQVRLLIN